MSKDAYWFRHDSTAGRGLKMKKMQHIYGHWGKGIYWDVIEVLREQSEYKFEKNVQSLQLLCDIISCKDEHKFINFMQDCINIELFVCDEKYFFSDVLCENMKYWDASKINGSKGGKAKSDNTNKDESNPNPTPPYGKNEKKFVAESYHNRIGYNNINNIVNFDSFRKLYPGTKRGKETEFDNFTKKTKDWELVLPHLKSIIEQQIEAKNKIKLRGGFVPEWKNLSTWINNRCWEEEIIVESTNPTQKRVEAKDMFPDANL